MGNEIELELTYLARVLPEGLKDCRYKEMVDIYLPKSSRHPHLRVRKQGDRFMITKKQPVAEGDSSKQLEQTIPITSDEFDDLNKLDGKRVSKVRYIYNHEGRDCEIDVFTGGLDGLVLVDFEFSSEDEKSSFKMPDFCLAEVTQEEFIAGGMLCGKNYSDIEIDLARFGYRKLSR